MTPSTVNGYYQPLSMISLMLDDALGGEPDNLRPFHRTSLALHAVNTMLVIVLLYMLFGEPLVAAMVGLLFGVHPLTVEPIPWVGERKTLLAAFFSLLALIAYVRYSGVRGQAPGIREDQEKFRTPHSALRTQSWYIVCVFCYVLALLSKPTSTPLPVCMLLLDYWPLRRLNWRAVLEKVPFYLIGIISAVITFISQQRTAHVFDPSEQSPMRIPFILCHNIVFYLYKMIWPVNLSSHYAFPIPMDLSQPAVLAGVIGTCIIFSVLLISLRWTRALLIGWLVFFVAIFPTMGVVGFTIVIASDKYAYIPSLGILMILAWFLGRLWSSRRRSRPVQLAICTTVLALAACEAQATRNYLNVWQDTERLYAHMLSLAPNAWQLHYNMGVAYSNQVQTDKAIAHYRRAMELNPKQADVQVNLGAALAAQNHLDEAVVYYRQALQLKPDSLDAHNNMGAAFAKQGRTDEAIDQYRRALQINPDCADAHINLGLSLARKGELNEAIKHYSRALQLTPNDGDVHNNIAAALVQQGKVDEAIAHLREAVRLNPDFAMGHKNLGQLLAAQGNRNEAVTEYREVLRIDPGNDKARHLLKAILDSQPAK